MAIGAPSIVANAGETTSDNQTVITTTAAIAAGNYIIAVAVSDGNGTNEGNDTTFHTGLSVGSVALTKSKEVSEAGSSAATSVTTSQWYGTNDTGSSIASGSNVTLDLDASHADKRIVVISGTLDSGKELALADGTHIDTDFYISAGSNDVVAESTSGMTSEEHLHWRTAGCDSTSTGWTGDATWTETHTNRQVTGSNGVGMAHKISTSTGETSDPSSNAGNGTEWASILVAYRQVTPSGGGITLTPATSTDAAQALGFTKAAISVSLTPATSTDAAQAVGFTKAAIEKALTAALETGTAVALSFSVGGGDILVSLTPAATTDSAQALGFTKAAVSVTLTPAAETDTAQALAFTQAAIAVSLTAVNQANVAQVLSGAPSPPITVSITPALETDTAQGLGFTKAAITITLTPAATLDSAQDLSYFVEGVAAAISNVVFTFGQRGFYT